VVNPKKPKTNRWAVKTQGEVAAFFDVTIDSVKLWRRKGMPGTAKCYDVREILAWLRSAGPWRPRDQSSIQGDAKQKRLEFQAKIEELRWRRQAGEVIPRDDVHDTYREIASSLRSAGEVLGRLFGDAAVEIINDALDVASRRIHDRFSVSEPSQS